MPDDNDSLDKVGRVMVNARDYAMSNMAKILDGTAKWRTPLSAMIQDADERQKEVLRAFCLGSIDEALHFVLALVEEDHDVDFAVRRDDGSLQGIKDLSDGLAGEFHTEDGWIGRFSEFPESE